MQVEPFVSRGCVVVSHSQNAHAVHTGIYEGLSPVVGRARSSDDDDDHDHRHSGLSQLQQQQQQQQAFCRDFQLAHTHKLRTL
jgi:hypothetical protein